MAEPTSVIGAGLAGAGAAVLSFTGLQGPPLFWALVGACIGMSFAATSSSRKRMYLVFVCSVLICALVGVWISDYYFKTEMSKNVTACIAAILFHPILNAVVAKVPALLDTIVSKLPVGK